LPISEYLRHRTSGGFAQTLAVWALFPSFIDGGFVRAVWSSVTTTQEALGLAAGLDRTFISQVERSRINVSLDNIERLAQALGVQAAELLQRPGHSVPTSVKNLTSGYNP